MIGSAALLQSGLTDRVPFNVLTDYAMFGAVSFETLAVASIFRDVENLKEEAAMERTGLRGATAPAGRDRGLPAA